MHIVSQLWSLFHKLGLPIWPRRHVTFRKGVYGTGTVGFCYVRHNSPFLRQGEIVADLFEPKLQISEGLTIEVNQSVKIDPNIHPYAIVVSQDCDLESDYKARYGEVSEDKLLTHVLFCALFSREEITARSKLKSDLWKRVRQNQDERYHHLDEAPVSNTPDMLPEFIADFKTTFSLPVELVHWLVTTN